MKIKRAIIIAINCPGYYSLAVHYLKLFTNLSRYLRKRCEIYTVEYDIAVTDTSILKNLLKLQPDLIAFSCYIWNIKRVIFLSKRIKKILPMSKLVLGGQEVTHSTVDYLGKYPFLDIIVNGEGEQTFKEIIYSMVEDDFKSLGEIKGLHYRDNAGIHIDTDSNKIINLDDIPSPYLQGKVKIPHKSMLGVMIEHVRGCPNTCTFCFEAMRSNSPKAFSLERVREEIVWAKSNGYDCIHLMDPVLCFNRSNKMEALNTIFKEVFHDKYFQVSVEVYAENINKCNYQYLDCYHIFDIGLQTINYRTNMNVRRKFDINKFREGFELIKALKGKTNLYLIYGLPGDDYDKFMEGICFVASLKPTTIFLNKLCVLDGTPLRHDASRFDLFFEIEPPYQVISNHTYSYSDIIKSEYFAQNFMRYYNAP